MATARADLAPWNKNKDYEWELSSGWGYKRPEDWDKGITRRRRKLHDTNGNIYDVYYYPDVDYHLGFSAQNDQERLAVAQKAFDPENPTHGEVIKQKGRGHIAMLEYAQREHILRVTFTNNGAVCIFFDVPTAVAGELIHLADKNTTRHKDGRHMLGIRFWDYIRIRGTQHGAKYPFEYESHGSGNIIQGNSRHTVKIVTDEITSLLDEADDANANNDQARARSLNQSAKELLDSRLMALFGNDPNAFNKMKALKNLKEDTELTIVLSDAEMRMYSDALKELSQNDPGGYIQPGHSDKPLVQLADALRKQVQDQIEAYKKDDAVTLSAYESDGLAPNKALMKALRETAAADDTGTVEQMLKSIDLRTGNAKTVQNYRQLKDFVRSIYGKGVIKSWMQEHYPAEYARRFTGRVWKVQELIDLANPTVEGNIESRHASTYKKFIQAKDWQGALNYLKTHKTSRTYKDRYGRTKKLTSVNYAGQYDTVEGDF